MARRRAVPTYRVQVPLDAAGEARASWQQPPIMMNVGNLGDDVAEVFAAILQVRRLREEIAQSCTMLQLIETANAKLYQKIPLWMTIPYIRDLPKDVYLLLIEYSQPATVSVYHLFAEVQAPTRLYVHVSPFLAATADTILDIVDDRIEQDIEILGLMVRTSTKRTTFGLRCAEVVNHLRQRPDLA